jgi:hypothetical protein
MQPKKQLVKNLFCLTKIKVYFLGSGLLEFALLGK